MKTLAVLIITAVGLTAQAQKHINTVPGPINLNTRYWENWYGGKLLNSQSGLEIQVPYVANFVPGTDQGSLGYFTTTIQSISGGTCNNGISILQAYCIYATVQVVTTGSPVFEWNLEPRQCDPSVQSCLPASIRLFFEQKNDNYTQPSYRWWSNPISIPLAQGVFNIKVPLTPDQWSDVNGVFGTNDLPGFNSAKQNVQNIGWTCGGGFFFGHGCEVTGGTASIVISSFGVTQ